MCVCVGGVRTRICGCVWGGGENKNMWVCVGGGEQEYVGVCGGGENKKCVCVGGR